jgi:hypothetical protein
MKKTKSQQAFPNLHHQFHQYRIMNTSMDLSSLTSSGAPGNYLEDEDEDDMPKEEKCDKKNLQST